MNKNILMICYYYPPIADVGSKRSISFSKYFKKHGWNPYVVTVKNPDQALCSVGNEPPPYGIPIKYSYSILNPYKVLGKINGFLTKLLKPFGIEIKRNYLWDILCIPDYFWGWIPLTTIKCIKLIKKYNIDLIYVSCTPFSSAVIGAWLKKLTGKSLVIDFRDPFALEINQVNQLTSPLRLRKNFDRTIANHLLKEADIFVVTSEETRAEYIKQYPQVNDKIVTIHNGFDKDFMPAKASAIKYKKFTITYMGEFYFYALESEFFFEGLSLLKKENKINKSNFQFLFFGGGKDRIEQLARDYELEDVVLTSIRVPYREALGIVSRSHLILLRIVKPMISTKLFEGIPLNIPFFATIPTGEVEKIIRKYSPSSFIVSEVSAEKVSDAILDAMEKYKHNKIYDNKVQEFLDKFDREKQTLKLMRIIEEITNQQPTGGVQ